MKKVAAHTSSPLLTPVQFVKGVGPILAKKLARMNIFRVEELFYLIPNRYIDRRKIDLIGELVEGKEKTVVGTLLSVDYGYTQRRAKVLTALFEDDSGTICAKWFHYNKSYMQQFLKVGSRILLAGDATRYGRNFQMVHPDIEVLDEKNVTKTKLTDIAGKILPVYPLTDGLYQKTMRKIMRNAWDLFGKELKPSLPIDFLEQNNLADPWEAIAQLHFPASDIDFEHLNKRRSLAHRTLIFDEFFFLELGLALKKQNYTQKKGVSFKFNQTLFKKFSDSLPFTWTEGQKRVAKEIFQDMEAASPMNRLLQGDVGSGKTVVALAAALQAIDQGYQVALMVPTEILAEQHFVCAQNFFKAMDIQVGLLTRAKEGKKELKEKLASGELPFVVGTQALIQEEVDFHKLGLVIIDEQHRFGVLQRKALHQKGLVPDVLVMTATPIPRTLAMTVYGDLSVSIIDELPKGRRTIVTRLYHEKQRERLYQGLVIELKKGHQIFVVYPLIEASENLDLKNATQSSEELKKIFEPKFKVSLLHGKMSSVEKEEIMNAFRKGNIDILCSTSVVEVGLDIPNATVMVIEHAERFGLSQLHQLRGRVGRADKPSYAILMADYKKSKEARQRLQVMVDSTDGFRIAEEDLSIRGPGEFLGTRQSGLPEFRVGNLIRDADILTEARRAAFALVAEDPNLTKEKHQPFRKILKGRWEGKLDLINIS